MTSSVAIGIDLGGTNLKVALVDSAGMVVARDSSRVEAGQLSSEIINAMVTLARHCMLEAHLDDSDVIGVGVGSPGPLSFSRGMIFKAANLAGWENVAVRDQLAELLGQRVVLDNDGNAAAFGEYWVGKSHDNRDIVLLTLGTGVGGGIVLDGEILRGHFENAGEIGHVIVEPRGRRCTCGKLGCLEQYASASAVVRRALEGVEAGESSSLKVMLDRSDEVTAQTIATLARQGDAWCQQAWDETCFYLAIACINIQHTFNPARVILGGGLACAGDQLIDGVKKHFDSLSWSLHDDFPEIQLASLGYEAGVIGAAGLAWQAFGVNNV